MTRQGALALAAGLLFGAGLAVSGMIDPARVRGFLNLAGAWDPTLGFVMAGAAAPMVLAWQLARKLRQPFAAAAFELPQTRGIDGRLVAGAALFGLEWGIAGLCPGPAVAALALSPSSAAPFVVAMLAGMALPLLVGAFSNIPTRTGKA